MCKSAALLFIPILAILALTMVIPAFAQTPTPSPTLIPTPSVPEFTVKFVNASYEVPTRYSIDPYTGQNVTHPSYYVNDSSIVITIRNQPFTSFIDNINGAPWNISLFYNVRMKGHYAENWTNIYLTENIPTASSSQQTVLTYPVEHYSNAPDSYILGDIMTQIPAGGQVDFQVEALIGYVHRVAGFGAWGFTGEESGWTNTQTITISATSVSPTATVPEFPIIVIALTALIPAVTAILFLTSKSKRQVRT